MSGRGKIASLAVAGVATLGLAFARPATVYAQQGPGMPPDAHMMHAPVTHTFLLLDRLEYAPDAAGRPVRLDAESWIGGARNRLWLRAEGDRATEGKEGEAELQALYSRLITPFFDAQVGVRVDTRFGEESDTRTFLALGLEGLAPGWFEVQPALFLSTEGDLSARLSASYDLLLTQRLVAQPSLELNAAAQAVPEFGVGSGLNDIDLGLRLRYEVRREFAPYVGVSWLRRVGETAQLARTGGEDARDFSVVAGVRIWR